jgi:hypothetical protein
MVAGLCNTTVVTDTGEAFSSVGWEEDEACLAPNSSLTGYCPPLLLPPSSLPPPSLLLLQLLLPAPRLPGLASQGYCLDLSLPFPVLGRETIGCRFTSNVFFMSVILFIGTYLIATVLKKFKTKRFFPTVVRSYISDFAVIIAIVLMVIVDHLFAVETPKLQVPSQFSPTWEGRGWLIHPFGSNPWWSLLVAPVPAALGCILIFMVRIHYFITFCHLRSAKCSQIPLI